MIIYGTALLACCHLIGIFLGDLLGALIGVKTNVGGVGIAMLLLICARLYMVPRSAATTFCVAAIATTTGMYIAPQNATPASVAFGSRPRGTM